MECLSGNDAHLVSLNELCVMLSISTATGRNWVRLGKLVPQAVIKRTSYFSPEYISEIKAALQEENASALKSRRNKKHISGCDLCNSYASKNSGSAEQVRSILNFIKESAIQLREHDIRAIIAECAVQLLSHDKRTINGESCLAAYLTGALELNGYDFLIDDLISNKKAALSFIKHHPNIFNIIYNYEETEDILGLLYISIRNLGERKVTGSYYTPAKVVQRLCDNLFEGNEIVGKKILDPCCGTGIFLLHLPDCIDFNNIYGNDADELSAKITRINLALKYSIKDRSVLYKHITNEDYLNHSFSGAYDFIIGNPPWGYSYTEKEKSLLKQKFHSASGFGVESYDLFIEQALHDLAPNGILSFVLPEALLSVRSHMPIRELLIKGCYFQHIDFLGNIFDKIQCPCIIFQAKYTGKALNSLGMKISDAKQNFVINTSRSISSDCFNFHITDAEYSILNKINAVDNACYLKNNAVFALGIVTGDNKKFLSSSQTRSSETILKGTDIYKYRLNPPSNYITFEPKKFQQAAPAEYYRAPEKLLYRFICNQLVFAYDNEQTLSLNSCNLLIPKFDDLCAKYILAVLNSRTAQYYFQKTFDSIKVLRSHLEQIPIPFAAKDIQDTLVRYVDIMLDAKNASSTQKAYEALDQKIAQLYNLTSDEYLTIKSELSADKLYM